MKNMKIAFLLMVIGIFSTLFISCDKKVGETLNIPLEVKLTDISPGATELNILSVIKSTLENPVSNPNITSPGDRKIYEAGEPCIIISAEFKNNTDNDTIVLLRADGYATDGVQRSWALDVGPLAGIANYDAFAQRTTHADITVNWADDLVVIRISASVRHQIYELSTEPLTPVPGN